MLPSLRACLLVAALTIASSQPVAYREPFPTRYSAGAYHIFSLQRKFYTCLSPKIGCSEWLKYIRGQVLPPDLIPKNVYARDNYPEQDLYFKRPASAENYTTLKRIAQDDSFFRFAVVRHPWDRIISAYRSKYEGICRRSTKCVKDNYRFKTPVDDNRPLGFHSFIKGLLRDTPMNLDPHFRPLHLNCELQNFPYDAYVELTNRTAMDEASKRMGFDITFSQYEAEHAKAYAASEYMGGRTHTVLPCTIETVRLIQILYGLDAAILGYSFDDAFHSCGKYNLTKVPTAEDKVLTLQQEQQLYRDYLTAGQKQVAQNSNANQTIMEAVLASVQALPPIPKQPTEIVRPKIEAELTSQFEAL
eukprot:TRINITY_DN11435_c0_g1_i10.p1 TRINITY_DN11435_c0_g1~~TRINITY_DN11435_c0_g1_i10.p1  ORF type:complete len:360 (+),score=56.65 TRINITY_DN11435_c0_g1_i10:319-1398(+)